ncbi:hypothetical protein SVAN01_01109 [Stagonosporopsis vannaccii]|nr:hypothetical protein SVAN01_01109 [Stagonosporopsis vannaccii]
MLTRILDATTHRIQAVSRTDSTFRRVNNAESTELHTLTAWSSEELGIDSSHVIKSSSANHTTSIKSGRPKSKIREYSHRFSGWRFGILNFATWASIVFLVNLIVTIWASVAHRATEGILREGDCGRIKATNSGVHVLINVLSTILLSGSNYCMQCLSAPTRREIDKAHGKREWLDVGVPSFRNLIRIGRLRVFLWLLLAVSSLPLHLLYNSAVYASISANSYNGFVVSQTFVDDPVCQNCTNVMPLSELYSSQFNDLWAKLRDGSLQRLEPAECIDAYGIPIQSSRRNLFVVVANENIRPVVTDFDYPTANWTNNKNLLLAWNSNARYGLDHYKAQADPMIGWICSGLREKPPLELCINHLEKLRSSSEPWMIGMNCYDSPDSYCDQHRWPVDYCLSERAEPRCRLHFSPLIGIIVTILNFFKALLMFYIVYFLKGNPLMTMGDAVASFLDERDVTTRYLGLMSIRDAKQGYSASATTWDNPRQRWKDATSRVRRIVTLILFAMAIITVTALLIWGVREINQLMATSTLEALSLGFGAVDPRTLISSGEMPTDMVSLALIANLPQVILSFLYFAYNSLFTAMLMGYEWTSYAHKRKGLRVSRKAAGNQRSTYFLQLPYRFALPLVVLSGTLHWLVSQSIFVVSFDIYDVTGEQITTNIGWEYDVVTRTVGYSPVAMLAVITMGILMVAAIVGFGYIPYTPGMPLAGSCSLAISAACHPEKHAGSDDGVLSKQKLQWGVVSTGVDGVGHCAFSCEEVGPLLKGRTYA